MTAPEEFSRNRKTVSGETAAAITQRYPTTVEPRIAATGTPRLLTRVIKAGASWRPASTKSIREAVYSPEFRQDSTAVRTTAFMMLSAYGIPMTFMAATYGDAPVSVPFHGRMTASRKTEPTKKMRIRMTTELVALVMARRGSSDSAAAMVAISAPTMEKMTTTMAVTIELLPRGRNPPWAGRLLKSSPLFGHSPRTKADPRARKAMMVATLMPANQNSNSPNEVTENTLVAVIRNSRIRDSIHSGASNQNVRILAPATASKPMTITQKYQFSQAAEKPAQPPSALRAYSVKDPVCGSAAAISPSIRITRTMSTPASP